MKNQTYCRIRQDLKIKGMNIPAIDLDTGNDTYIPLRNWEPCTQPNELVDQPFNVIVDGKYAVYSIDVEFSKSPN